MFLICGWAYKFQVKSVFHLSISNVTSDLRPRYRIHEVILPTFYGSPANYTS